MNDQAVADILNELLACEQGSLVTRLQESTVFISRLSVDEANLVDRIAQASTEHSARLVEAILQLGGAPGLRSANTASADLHYQELYHVWPRLFVDRQGLMQKYALAAQRVGEHPLTAALVQHILQQHQEELDWLQRLAGRNVNAAG